LNPPTALGARHLSADAEGTLPKHPVVGRSQQMPTDAENVLDDPVHGQKSLRVSR